MTYNDVISKLAENVKLIDTYIKTVFVPEIPEGQFVKIVDGNLIDIDVPEYLLRKWYEERLVPAGVEGKDFEDWFWNYSIADDMDGFFNFTEWRPFLADIKEGL